MPFDQHSIALHIKTSLAALLATRAQIVGRPRTHTGDSGGQWFADNDKDWGTGGNAGLVSSLQGIHTVFNALSALDGHDVNAWQVLSPEENTAGRQSTDTLSSLLDEWIYCLDEIERSGYHADPYDLSSQLEQMFKKAEIKSTYTDTVAWALSTSVLVNHVLTRTTATELLKAQNLTNIIERTRALLKASLIQLIRSQSPGGGWGWWPKSKVGHLIFTWSVIGSLADFSDYVLGESEQEIEVGPDVQTIEYIAAEHPEFRSQLVEAKRTASLFLSDHYLTIAKERDFTAEDLEDSEISVISKDSLALFYCDLYLLEALVLLGYHESGTGSPNARLELESLFGRIVARLPRVKDSSFADDLEASTLTFKIQDPASLGIRNQLTWISKDGGLWPQLLRSLVLYRFYVLNDLTDPWIAGDQGSALRLLMNQRRPEAEEYPNVWDTWSFNLAITARAISGLVDAYDYFDLQSKLLSSSPAEVQAEDGLAVTIADALLPLIEERLMARFGQAQPGDEAKGPARSRSANVSGAPFGESEAISLKRELEATLKAAIAPGVLNIVSDCAAPEWLPARGMINPDWVTEQLLGKQIADRMRGDRTTESAYGLLRMLCWVSFMVNVKLLPSILQEAVLERMSNESRDSLRSKVGDGKPWSLAGRFREALETISKLESDSADLREEDRPNYRKAVNGLMPGTSSRVPTSEKAGKRS